MYYTLPCAPALLRQDRFDVLESDEFEVSFWRILDAIISRKAANGSDLIDQLETIAVTLHDTTGDCDYGFLRTFITQWTTNHFFDRVWPELVDLALEMPRLFPQCSLPVLCEKRRQVILSRRQVACLVIHQFLGTLLRQPWETDSSVDFHVWYSSSPGHSGAKEAYLTALFTYFERIVSGELDIRGDSTHPITFTLRTIEENDLKLASVLEYATLLPMTVSYEPTPTTAPPFLGLPDGACVIFANRNVGFGMTGTQEEMHVGASPECCPVVLLAPTLRDKDALIVEGPEAMISMIGYGREARLSEVLPPRPTSPLKGDSQPLPWDRRTMLFMDALELDTYHVQEGAVPDLLPGHVDRELTKAYAAFSSRRDNNATSEDGYTSIVTGLWGCGAFGGNREIKTLIQWCAASLAGVALNFICAGPNQSDFATCLENFVDDASDKRWRVRDVLEVLRRLRPNDAEAREVFSFVVRSLDRSAEW
ncbi:hypothetical protein VTO42DRAFT_3110 [Malbranchea cinnamomea]